MKLFEKINPAIKASPLMILLTMLVPQVLLALFRTRTLFIIRTEIAEHATLIYAHYLVIPLALAGTAALLLVWSRRSNGDLPRWIMLAFFLLQTASLVSYLFVLENLLPNGVDSWIVPSGPFIMLQLAGAMPGLFYSLICLANTRLFQRTWINISTSFGLLVAIPTTLYLIFMSTPGWDLPETFVVGLFIVATLIAAFTFLQLLLWISGHLRFRLVATILFALVLPVCGLLLNRAFPFPADLQHWGFYALTLANATILLLACHPTVARHPLYGWTVAFSYPFTCYFFFLFLPFLPFSLLAMIAVGAGFLILTPTVLFILHTRQLIDQFKANAARFGRTRVATAFIAAFLLVPAGYVGRAMVHRQVFAGMLDRVYAAPIDSADPMPSPRVAAYALKRLHATKEGVYIPILSETYNRIVFGGMVLPDRKIEQLDQLLLGGEPGEVNFSDGFAFYSFFTDESTRTSGRNDRRPSREVILTEVDCSAETANAETETTVLLTLESGDAWQSEYAADIILPNGVFVSGYDLQIDGEMVPARLSDRRAALWVYHMIRDQARRDPGLLVYTGPNTLHLSVFPFAADQERQCALKLLYPAHTSPEIKIGDQTVALPSTDPATVSVLTPMDNQAICIPSECTKKMPATQRIMDRTELSGSTNTPGYCAEWDVKKTLIEYWDSGDAQLTHVPWFTTTSEQPVVRFDSAAYWLPLIPDSGWSAEEPEKQATIPFKCGGQIRVVPADRGGIAIFNSANLVERYDGARLQPFTADVQIGPETRYAKVIDLWQNWWQIQLHPEREEDLRRSLLLSARELNVLIPSTAFLVVESAAQSKALKNAEDKSLKSNANLAFDEFDSEKEMGTPEPSLLLLVILVLPILHWMQHRKTRHENA